MEISREQWNRLKDQITKLQTDLYYRDVETVTAIVADEHTILIAVASTPAYTNVINNIPVVYAPTNLVISLGG